MLSKIIRFKNNQLRFKKCFCRVDLVRLVCLHLIYVIEAIINQYLFLGN